VERTPVVRVSVGRRAAAQALEFGKAGIVAASAEPAGWPMPSPMT